MKYRILAFVLFLSINSFAQTYKTYQKTSDTTYVETVKQEVEEPTQLSKDEVVQSIFSEIDKWVDIESRRYLESFAAKRIYNSLILQQLDLVPDTSYITYNARWDKEYSYPELTRDSITNQIIYDSELLIGDTTYSVQVFQNPNGIQVARLQEPAQVVVVRHIRGNKIIRLNGNVPQLSTFADLYYINESRFWRVYFAVSEGKVVRLKIRKYTEE